MGKVISRNRALVALLLVMAVLLLVWLVTSCGSGASPSPTQAPSSSAAAVVPTSGPSGTSTASPAGVTASPSASPSPDASASAPPTSTPTTPPTPQPTAKPTPKPTPVPTPTPVQLLPKFAFSSSFVGGYLELKWGSCQSLAAGAPYRYVLVRSPDSDMTYPLGANDTAVVVIVSGGTLSYTDKAPPPGALDYYRVFCFNKADKAFATTTGYLAVTFGKGVIGLTVTSKATSNVLTWSACKTTHFSGYLIARSTGSSPSLVPLVRGTVTAATIGPAGPLTWSEPATPSLTKVYYRVQCIVDWEGAAILSAESTVRSVFATVK